MRLRFKADVISLKPKVVVILAGMNDIAQNTGYTPNEIIAENIAAMAELPQNHAIEVFLCSVLPAIGFPWSPEIKPAGEVIKLNKMISSYASTNDLIYVDYYSAIVHDEGGLKASDFTAADDLVHPITAGYAVMLTVAKSHISEVIDIVVSSSMLIDGLLCNIEVV